MSTTLLPSSMTAAAAPTSPRFSKFSANVSLTRLNLGSQVPSIFTAMRQSPYDLAHADRRRSVRSSYHLNESRTKRRTVLRDRAAAARARARGASEAMRSCRDACAREFADVVDVPDCRCGAGAERNFQHL